MEMIKENPVKIRLPASDEQVRKFLTYTDRSVNYQLKKLSDNVRWKYANYESWESRQEQLKSQKKKCLLFFDEDGTPYTYSGLWLDLQNRFGWGLTIEGSAFLTKEPKLIPWKVDPESEGKDRYYQTEALQALISVGHGSVELPTGSGKTRIILKLAKHFGLKTVIVSPSKNVSEQLYKDFIKFFGKKYVGMFGGGRKVSDKLFTVCVAKSLTMLKTEDEHYDNFYNCDLLIWDESHTTPAETFEEVCLGVARRIANRFFVSATQTRTDGSELKLRGIIGPVVYRKTFRELVEEKYLAKPLFKMFNVPATTGAGHSDPNTETRKQLFLNPHVNSVAAQIAEKAVRLGNRQVLILIEEFNQFMQLKNFMTVPFEFAHGPVGAEVKEYLPKQYWTVDNQKLIDEFNSGKIRVLIGTSAVSMGVDTRPVGCLIYLQGGSSEIKVKQGLGRASRPVKPDFWFVDFNVRGSPHCQRHYQTRLGYYRELGDSIDEYG